MSTLQKDMMKKNLPPLPPRGSGAVGGPTRRRKRDYSPLPWSDFFDRCEDLVTKPGNCFRVYLKGCSGPALLLLHGGGHSALSWAVFAVAVSKLVECQVVAMDLRGHGVSHTGDDDDLSVDTLVTDIADITEAVFKDRDPFPPIVLVGHSMGGAIAARVAARNVVKSLVGLAVIDVVEGTAMESLGSMQSYLRGRPDHFKSLEMAVEWSIRSGQLHNADSARVSMPGQVTISAGSGAVSRDKAAIDVESLPSLRPPPSTVSVIQEGEEEEGEEKGSNEIPTQSFQTPPLPLAPRPSADKGLEGKYVWRVDLKKTECHWKGWFEGLSQLFLSIPVPKMLILAGVDRLDKQLTIGQMQGKFQMQVLAGCGHSVHEDAPDKVAEVVSNFLIRHKFARQKELD